MHGGSLCLLIHWVGLQRNGALQYENTDKSTAKAALSYNWRLLINTPENVTRPTLDALPLILAGLKICRLPLVVLLFRDFGARLALHHPAILLFRSVAPCAMPKVETSSDCFYAHLSFVALFQKFLTPRAREVQRDSATHAAFLLEHTLQTTLLSACWEKVSQGSCDGHH
jgi:hypothetical protein